MTKHAHELELVYDGPEWFWPIYKRLLFPYDLIRFGWKTAWYNQITPEEDLEKE